MAQFRTIGLSGCFSPSYFQLASNMSEVLNELMDIFTTRSTSFSLGDTVNSTAATKLSISLGHQARSLGFFETLWMLKFMKRPDPA